MVRGLVFFIITILIQLVALTPAQAGPACLNLFPELKIHTTQSKAKITKELTRILECTANCEELKSLFLSSDSDSNPEFVNILKYFDLKSIALLGKGKALKEISSLDFIKDVSAEYQQRHSEIQFAEINSLSDFLKAAQKLVGNKLQFRSEDVIMTSEINTEQSHILSFDSATLAEIKKIKYLELYDESVHSSVMIHTSVAYSSFAVLKKLSRQNPTLFSPEMAAQLRAVKVNHDGTHKLGSDRALYRKALKVVMEHLFQQSKLLPQLTDWANASPGDLFSTYKAFMALHPFMDGNGRVGRLLYEFLSWKMTGQSEHVTLPLFDLDLLSARLSIDSYLAAGSFLNDWVSRASSIRNFNSDPKWP